MSYFSSRREKNGGEDLLSAWCPCVWQSRAHGSQEKPHPERRNQGCLMDRAHPVPFAAQVLALPVYVTGCSLLVIELNNQLKAVLYFPSVSNTEGLMWRNANRESCAFSRNTGGLRKLGIKLKS